MNLSTKMVALIFAAVFLISCTSEAAEKQANKQIITESEAKYAEKTTAEESVTGAVSTEVDGKIGY